MDALTTRMCSEFTYTIVPLLWVRYVKEDVAKHSCRNWLSASDHPWRPWEVTIIASQHMIKDTSVLRLSCLSESPGGSGAGTDHNAVQPVFFVLND